MSTLVYDGKEYPLTNELVMGRHRDCSIPLADGKASRRHARVFLKSDGTVWVEDLDSANGTLVNSEEIFSPRQLFDGDRVVIGKSKVLFRGDTVETTPAHGSPVIADPKAMVGTLVGGCRIGEMIGAGSMGVVYRGKQLSLDREVAVKIFSAEVVQRDQAFAERFLKEARLAGSIQHPSVVQIHECGQQDNVLWYSMELVEGDTVEDLLARDGKFEPMLALIVTEQAAAALQAAHAKNIVHRDLTPANLMLSKEGKIKLLDLGLSRAINSGRATGKKTVIGNPWYMSPERAKGEDGDARSDIYSLGCTLYQLITGDPPFDDSSPKAILKAHLERPIPSLDEKAPGLPKKLDEIVHSMLSKNPEWRYGTMEEVIADLRLVRDALPRADARKPRGKERTPVAGSAGRPSAPSPEVYQAVAERAQDRMVEQAQHRTRNFLIFVLVVVCLGVAYSFSGISLPVLLRNLADKGNGQGAAASSSDSEPGQAAVHAPKPVEPEVAAPVEPVPPAQNTDAEALQTRWKAVQEQIDGDVKASAWGAAEMRLTRFAAEAAKQPAATAVAQGVRLRRDQLGLDGTAWYRQQLASMPAATGPRLDRLGELRDVVLSGDRREAESLYQEALAKLNQQLLATRRQARQQLQAGHPETLPKLAADLEPSFRDTPVIGLQRQFAVLAREAAGVAKLWHGDWAATREQLHAAKGADALAAGAALILSDAPAEAKKVLMGEPALAVGDLLRRREALFGREAAVLSFRDPSDLQFIETLQGDPKLDAGNGCLYGLPGDPVGFACTVPVGGESWSAAITLSLKDQGAKGGQVVVSCVKGDSQEFLLRIDPALLTVKARAAAGMEEQRPERPKGDPLAIRIVCRANRLQVIINNVAVAESAKARIPPGCQFRIEIADVAWKLTAMQVVGGE